MDESERELFNLNIVKLNETEYQINCIHMNKEGGGSCIRKVIGKDFLASLFEQDLLDITDKLLSTINTESTNKED